MKRLPMVLALVYAVACTTGAAQKTEFAPGAALPISPAAADATAAARRLSGAGLCRVHFDGDGRVDRAEIIRSTGSTTLDEDTMRSAHRNWQGLPGSKAVVPVKYGTVPSGKRGTIRYDTPAPAYPFWASRRQLSGTCVLQVLFDAQGQPNRVLVARSCGSSLLDQFTVRYAFAHWKSSGGEESVLTYPVTYLYRE